MNQPFTKSAALHLYRQLLRYGRQLQHTDKDFYFNRIRQEFQENRNLTIEKDIEFVLKRGEAVLKNRKII